MFELNGQERPEPTPPAWFANRDDDPEEPESEGYSLRSRVIVAAAMLIILILLLIPVLQAVLLERQRDNLPDEQFQRTAVQFASAVYFSRSTGQALLFAAADARDDVENVVNYFRDQPANSPQARVQVSVTACPRAWDDAEICYLGQLFDTGGNLTPAIEFGLTEQDGEPAVIFVQLDQTSVLAPGLSRS